MDRFPQMVGSTNGIPAVTRDQANRSILASQRQAVAGQLDAVKNQMREEFEREGHSDTSKGKQIKELSEALHGIDQMQGKLGPAAEASNYYLLGLDSTAEHRGQAIIAHGNPDHADNTMTMVPGTYSDLGGVVDYVEDNDKVLQQADAQSDSRNVAITWSDYESPNSLIPGASLDSYADNAHSDLSQFQEGLRVTHEGEAPSHNTLMGHSYGSTVVGEAATNGGSHADNLVFLGSPGVGVDDANQLDVPSDQVWGGTSRDDKIHGAVSINPADYGNGRDDHWFGVNPSDPAFGGNTLPTEPTTPHDGYWDKPISRDAMADIMVGKGGSK